MPSGNRFGGANGWKWKLVKYGSALRDGVVVRTNATMVQCILLCRANYVSIPKDHIRKMEFYLVAAIVATTSAPPPPPIYHGCDSNNSTSLPYCNTKLSFEVNLSRQYHTIYCSLFQRNRSLTLGRGSYNNAATQRATYRSSFPSSTAYPCLPTCTLLIWMPNYVYQQPRTFFSCAFFPQNRHGQPTWYQGWALTKKLTRWQATRLHTTAARLRLEVRAYAWCGVAYPSPPCNLSSMTFPLKNTRARIYLEGYLFYLASKCTVTPSTSIDGSSLTAYTLMAPTHSSECQPSSKLCDQC